MNKRLKLNFFLLGLLFVSCFNTNIELSNSPKLIARVNAKGETVIIVKSNTRKAVCYYSTDGSEPTLNSPKFSEPLVITGSIKIKAFAIEENMSKSEIVEEQFDLLDPDYLCIVSDGEIKITGYRGVAKHIDIPSEMGGFSIISIENSAFAKNTTLISVTISESVFSIGHSAFKDCQFLKSINIPNSVTVINDQAFFDCTALNSITFSKGIKEIGSEAFMNCTSLSSLEIPETVENIRFDAFKNCVFLNSVIIPHSLSKIEGGTFEGCSSLSFISIPNSIIYIGGGAFANCISLKSVFIPASVVNLSQYIFLGCRNLKEINCEVTTQPEGWAYDWGVGHNAKVNWGMTVNK